MTLNIKQRIIRASIYMTDRITKEQRSKNMRAIKNKDTSIERTLRKVLWEKGYMYRKNCKDVYGKPDIVFKKQKLAIFCDSKFWHGYDWENQKKTIKSNRDFWFPKIERNIMRDKEVNEKLKQNGWNVLRFWEDQIEKDTNSCLNKIISFL